MILADDRALLLSCLQQDGHHLDPEALPAGDDRAWDRLIDFATLQRVRPVVHATLTRPGLAARVPARVLEALGQASRRTALRNMRFLAELGQLERALAAHGARIIALKGGHLAGAWYADVGRREMSDLDILVQPGHLPLAVDTLRSRGYTAEGPLRIETGPGAPQHLARFAKNGTAPIEVHWTISPPLIAHPIDPDQLWHRAVPWSCAGVSALGLCAEDLLLHLCFHASFHHQFQFVGLRPFCDVATVIERSGSNLNWDALVERAREWQWSKGVHLSLRMAATLVGARVPEPVFGRLHAAGAGREVLQAAVDQLFAPRLYPNVARLSGPEPLAAKLRHIRRRLEDGSGPTRSRRGWSSRWSRLVTGLDLARRHGRTAVRLWLGKDRALMSLADRTDRIRRWLED